MLKKVGRVMVLVLCTSSDHAFIFVFVQSFMKIFRNHDGRTDRRTDTQTDGQDDYYGTSTDLVWRGPNNSLNMYFRDIERTQFQIFKFSKENNSVKL